jgi:hypothetical protein
VAKALSIPRTKGRIVGQNLIQNGFRLGRIRASIYKWVTGCKETTKELLNVVWLFIDIIHLNMRKFLNIMKLVFFALANILEIYIK